MLNLAKIHDALNASNLHLYEVARLAGISERTLRRIYSGQTKDPGIATAKKIAQALGLELLELLK